MNDSADKINRGNDWFHCFQGRLPNLRSEIIEQKSTECILKSISAKPFKTEADQFQPR